MDMNQYICEGCWEFKAFEDFSQDKGYRRKKCKVCRAAEARRTYEGTKNKTGNLVSSEKSDEKVQKPTKKSDEKFIGLEEVWDNGELVDLIPIFESDNGTKPPRMYEHA